jgi:glyoxylase-like metal-dependent hydrolase (beta-lactamase superfamily II)
MSSRAPTSGQAQAGDFVSIRRFGELEVAVVDAGVMHWSPMFAEGQEWRPGATLDDEGRSVLGINGMIAKTPEALVVIDPNSLGPEDSPSTATLTVGAGIGPALTAFDVDPLEVTHVLITHGHFDHFTGLLSPRDSDRLRFPNAEHVFPEADMPEPGATGPHIDEVRHVIGIVQASGRLRLVSGDVELAPGVAVLAAPGESPGHQIVRLDGGADLVYYLGDLVHFPIEVEHPDWVALRRDAPTLLRTRHRVFSDPAGRDAVFVFTHSRFPAWGRIESTGPDGWAWQFD